MIILIVVVVLAIAQFGPQSSQGPALAVAAVVLLLLLAGGLSRGTMGRSSKDVNARRSEFHAKARDASDTQLTTEKDADLWARERARYAEKQRENQS